jgi:hypothetical protein
MMLLARRAEMNRSMTAVFFLSCCAVVAASAEPARLTKSRLEGLKSSSNDPAGDAFLGGTNELGALVDAFVADSSLAGPMQLYLAANTAQRLGRVEDAAFLLYAAQLRKAFDYQRYDVSREPDGSNAATYLSFLNQTIGESLNPAIMGEPKLFAAVIRRLESWDVVPSPQAYEPEFQPTPRLKLERASWPAKAQSLKDDFMSHFGHRYATLLNDQAYFEAFQFVQGVNLGKIDARDAKSRARLTEMNERMAKIERKLDGAPDVPATASTMPAASPSGAKAGLGREAAIRELAKYGYGPEAPTHKKPIDGSSLAMAAGDGYDEIVDLLLAAGAPVDGPLGSSPVTALFMSVDTGHLDIAATLLKAGANPNLRDENGYTPFIHLAKYCDEIELVRTFIKAGADVNATTPRGWTALQEAERADCEALVKELRKSGAKK